MQIDPTLHSYADNYKVLTSVVVPRPIAWVVTLNAEGRQNAAPFSFFNVVCGAPPIVLIGIGRREGQAKDTAANIRVNKEFVVNLVSAETAEQMNITAIDFGPEVDELEQAGLTTLPSARVAPQSGIDCRIVRSATEELREMLQDSVHLSVARRATPVRQGKLTEDSVI